MPEKEISVTKESPGTPIRCLITREGIMAIWPAIMLKHFGIVTTVGLSSTQTTLPPTSSPSNSAGS